MKFTNTLFALMTCLTATMAAPTDEEPGCEPPSYQCNADTNGWEVCSASGIWVVSKPKIYPYYYCKLL
jgi:hypothetical protein